MRHAESFSSDAAAFRVAAALERYQAAVAAITVRADPEPVAIRELAASFRVLRLECAGLPVVNVSWAALLISHFEVMHLLPPGSQALASPRARAQSGAQVQRLQFHIEALALECRTLMGGHRHWRPATHPDGAARPA